MTNILNFFGTECESPNVKDVKKYIFLVLLILPVFGLYSQTIVKGKVVDEKDQPLYDATVIVKSSNESAVTDTEGNFELSTDQSFPLTIEVIYLGYVSQEVVVADPFEPVAVSLLSEAGSKSLNEVVVVGYGTQRRRELTGAVTTISKETLSQPAVSVDNLLGGSVAGLSISQGGQPGSAFSARIRGGNSINASNEPLYVVDGVILYSNSTTSAGVSTPTTGAGVDKISASLNPLASLNPNDIESVEVLKDVSATAIYGSRGSNGVIIITTKSGRRGKPKIEYEYSLGFQEVVKKLKLLNASQWAELNKEIDPNGVFKDYTSEQISALGKGYDWQDAALRSVAINQNHYVSIGGGDAKTRYLISGGYTDQEGILKGTDFKRYTGRINFDRDILDNLSVGVIVNASKAEQNGYDSYTGNSASGFSSPFNQIIKTSPVNPIYNPDGSFNYNNQFELGDLRKGDVTTNGLSDLLNTTAQNVSNSLLGNFNLRYTIIPGLIFKLAAGTNIVNTTQNFYAPSYTTNGFQTDGYASVGNSRTDIWQYEYTLNYTKRLHEDHYIDALAGYTTQTTKEETAIATATDFANDQLLYHNLQSGGKLQAPESRAWEARLNSVIGRVNYTFKNRYNLTATIRADGSSRFATDKKWGYFPSAGISWNVNREAFLEDSRYINDLKIRASVGTVGNQEIGNYKYEQLYNTTPNYSFNQTLVPGFASTNLGNPDLKWETTTSYNAGLDLSLFKSRLSFVFDLYYKKTSDLLLEVPVEVTTGFSSVLRNVGSVSNKGFELEVRGVVIDTKDFNWAVSANIAKNTNRVEDLGGLDRINVVAPDGSGNISSLIFVGQSLGSNYLIEYDGVIQKGEDLSKIAGPSWKTTVEYGDERFIDQNGDGVVDETSDRIVIGSSIPDITYGFSTTLSYKSLSLYIAFQGVSGNKIYNSLRQSLEQPNKSYNGLATLVDRWTETNPSTTIPKARNVSGSYRTSRYLEDGAYLRLKTVTLRYILPVKIAKAPSAQFSIFASAQNVFTITDYTGYDPEIINYNSSSGVYYPLARTFSLGVNLSY
jgi:TonB-linked SusC/RagA family outer membrane protein